MAITLAEGQFIGVNHWLQKLANAGSKCDHCVVSDDMQNCQVELVFGSGVFVSGLFYAQCCVWPTTDGIQLVRKLVREVFTDDEILSVGTCSGMMQRQPRTKKTLDEQKVNAVIGLSLIHI